MHEAIGPTGPAGKANEPIGPTGTAQVITLAERAQEVITITELEPGHDLSFVGKQIGSDGNITDYPRITWWRQRVARIPATIPHLFAYLRGARERNIGLI